MRPSSAELVDQAGDVVDAVEAGVVAGAEDQGVGADALVDDADRPCPAGALEVLVEGGDGDVGPPGGQVRGPDVLADLLDPDQLVGRSGQQLGVAEGGVARPGVALDDDRVLAVLGDLAGRAGRRGVAAARSRRRWPRPGGEGGERAGVGDGRRRRSCRGTPGAEVQPGEHEQQHACGGARRGDADAPSPLASATWSSNVSWSLSLVSSMASVERG